MTGIISSQNIHIYVYTRIACNSQRAFEIFSTHFRRGIFTFHEGRGGGECIALHAVKRYPQRFVSYIYVYKVSYNLGMRGGKDEFAIHVPRGVFGADSSRKFLAKSSPPGFVKRRPLIWKLHATPTSFQNDQLQIQPRSIYHRLAIFNRNSFPSGF